MACTIGFKPLHMDQVIMPVLAAFLYRNGKRLREVGIEERIDCPEDRSEFLWIGVSDPTAAEMEQLRAHYDLHPLAVEDALRANQLPKLDVYTDQLFVLARTAHYASTAITYGETAIFVSHRHIISVRYGSARSHTPLRDQLEAVPDLLGKGVDYVLHAILDYIVNGYLPIIEAIEEEVLAMEQHTLDSFIGREEITRIFMLRRELMRFQRVLTPMNEVATKLVKMDMPCIDDNARPYFSDVRDHIRRVQSMVDDLREVLTSVFEYSNLLEQQRTGAITRQLAAWAAILAVPTAIAGIYGMNFEYMPGLKTHDGFAVTLSAITLFCVFLYARFRRYGWL